MKKAIGLLAVAGLMAATAVIAQPAERGRDRTRERPADGAERLDAEQRQQLQELRIQHRESLQTLRAEQQTVWERIQTLAASEDATDEQILRAVERSSRIHTRIQRARAEHFIAVRGIVGAERAARFGAALTAPGPARSDDAPRWERRERPEAGERPAVEGRRERPRSDRMDRPERPERPERGERRDRERPRRSTAPSDG